MEKSKIIFMGTPEFAVPVLQGLIDHQYEIVLVVTQPDKPVGRKQVLTASPIKQLAMKYNIPVFQPEKIRKDYEPILQADADAIITCAYGQIIPEAILESPKIGCFNVHASLLPKYRGGAPIHKALINGEEKTGITLMYMDKGMDTGDMIAKVEYVIQKEDNVGTLHDKLSVLGANLLIEHLPSILSRTNLREKQKEEEASYAYNVKREEEHLDFHQDGKAIINQIRGLNPWPTANLILNGEEMKVLEAEFQKESVTEPCKIKEVSKNKLGITCQDGIIYLKKIKPFGKKIMPIEAFLNGIKKEQILNKEVE